MSDHVMMVSLSELTVIRIRCKGDRSGGVKCDAVFEMPLSAVPGAFRHTNYLCPFCQNPLTTGNPQTGGRDELSALARAIIDVSNVAGKVAIEFPVKQP